MTETARKPAIPIEIPDPQKVKAELLAKYPPKVARKRAKQIVVNRVEAEERVPKSPPTCAPFPG
jgi:nitrogenase molybdenum-iron protein alpha chain